MRTHVVIAIFKRNFVSYFSSPIGYVFICAFVLMSSFATFWPNEFFNANLANLGQLNKHLPWILLAFIPAITMSIWAEERHQGTDELLLTIPADDREVVAGKYLAALMIYTVSLLFSLFNIVVLMRLGDPDLGLLVANYLGYWCVGAGMLAIGMVASFLTGNLTVGFILAAAFNAPLAFTAYADAIVSGSAAVRSVEQLSIAEQFSDFERGVLSLSSVCFFASIAVVMIYLSMVLIGRRHWSGRSAGMPMALHYGIRVLALAGIALGVNVLAGRFDLRWDMTSERLSSLTSDTRELLKHVGADRPVYIEAYISPTVPDRHHQTRINLLNMLREVDAQGGDRVIVRVNETERFSDQAAEAEEQFGIRPQMVQNTAGGRFSVDEIFLGVAVMGGLDKVVTPFFDPGIPVEYELIRSIATVSQQERRTIGVLTTDARLFGGFDFQSMASLPDQPIITELKKQYEVVQVNAVSPIPEDLDALVAVQPSSLPQAQMDHFIEAVRRGIPTAVFEDPFPFLDGAVPATSQPRRPPRSNPFAQQPPPEPKGDIGALWSLLQVRVGDAEVVWDDYNPYPKLSEIPPEFVFVGRGSGNPNAFGADSAASSGLQELLLVFPGAIRPLPGAANQFTPLLQAGTKTGVVPYGDIIQQGIFGPAGLNPNRRFIPSNEPYTLAMHIRGPAATDDATPGRPLDVVLVADIDLLYREFFRMRAQGTQEDAPINITLDNVTFILNVLDELAGDDRFIEIRKRRPVHRTLTAVERRTDAARRQATEQREAFLKQFEASRAKEEQALQRKVDELKAREGIDPQQMILEASMFQQAGQKKLEATIERLERERDHALELIEIDLSTQIRRVQDTYKLAAVALPPVPPLLVAFIFFIRRRRLERIGVPTSRLRH